MREDARESFVLKRLAAGVVWGLAVGSLSLVAAAPAQAAPPAVTLVSPADGAAVGTSTPLVVSVADADGDAASVTFEGRKKGLTVPGPTSSEPFSIAVVPDTQNYTYNNRWPTMNQQSQWLVDNRERLDLAFTVHVGDLVSEYTNPAQWQLVSAALKILDDANMPNSVVPGNHDFDNATGAVGPFDQYFPVSRYADAVWNTASTRYGGHLGQSQFGADPIDRRNFDNYALFTAGGTDFLVLNLEWEAPTYALEWADRVLAAHPDRTVIMVTHSFLTVSGSRWTGTQRPGGTSQAQLWNNFVSTHCQIRVVIAGHEHNGNEGEASRTDANTCGRPVHQLMTDYQDRPNGGDGWLRYYTFDPAANTMTATTYSPKLDRYETDANSSFVLPFELTPPVPAPFETIGTATVSGGTATATWGALAADTAYEWRAVVSAGGDTITSPVYTLRTAPLPPRLTDTFTRTTASGWGTADTGQTWVPASGASSFTVDGANGRITTAPGQSRSVDATVFRSTDLAVDAELTTSVAPGGSGGYISLLGRDTGSSDYRATVQLSTTTTAVTLRRVVNGAETVLATQRISGGVTAGTVVRVRFELSGTAPTTLRAKVWTGAVEPSAWSATTTDATAALQTSGGVGAYVYLSSTAGASVSTLLASYSAVGGTGSPPLPANTPPTAVISTPAITGRAVTVNGSGSTDTDGTIATHAWNWGDGTPAETGASKSHTYAADGTYVITLTVTDDKGATHSTTRSVTVTQPPPIQALVADDFGRSVTNGWGAAEVGGAWTATGTASRFAVADGVGLLRLTTPGTSAQVQAAATPAASAEVRLNLSWDRTAAAGALYTVISPRAVSSSADYRLKVYVSGTVPYLDLIRRTGGVETLLSRTALPDRITTAGTWYSVAVRATTVNGVTTLSAKLWPRAAAEPSTWQATTTDSTAALQTTGTMLLWSYMSGSATAPVATSFDGIRFTSVTP
ncbi:PKD domain-containing protein [Microbacterium sp. Root166]|uniref:PKD domain-containing protein n=1 Tax=Microbacterium sp. Root166 TaxID=1736478 RepID=UPI0012FC3EA1|nr:PKD domain-containing protein [Microbacterium sp. Root166]